ncbi:hypothetical protein MCOR27_007990 [Pyricularia oryzae]|uniref:Uncharacterized protein n=5 Tax=Pyricularia TaxID=48558 RepID=A0ABQ8NWE1_PYRGI|nr:3-oxoacyl-[acyl-carrier-protein] reductase [Pyricularia oryzae 70-15]ELQ38637.1 3-oxoacyl-[acyl-carrier-protein] reductase [Pyricularia oryzae Y34]KAH8842480.1 hypothetical protein MCOR01_006386 [Pyricularia oryzae]KAI6302127.1 hypothetical protein MCOR33_002444 [Pyricularia grisea]EHA56755.1 3-oxoacyl-[acyl-carrier-protein] reductase [Pyricularia oryzae 70-15]KAH9435725.1 hypothetical protein MCOR02_004644 [Pyricularia oryzae]
MSVDNNLVGRLALITGASGGIGAAIAKDLWSHGSSLALTYWSSREKIDALVAELEKSSTRSNTRISVHRIDMGTPNDQDFDLLFQEIVQLQGQSPSILVANAGYGKRFTYIEDIELAEFDYMMRVNLRAPFILAKQCVPDMAKNKWGRLIFISSIAAYGGGINGPHYAASKGGVTSMMRNLSARYAKDGITANDVAPAMIGETGMIPNARAVEGTAGDVRNIPVGRLGAPQEVANAVTMLCRTGYLTGQSIVLSGGLR